MSLCEVIFLLKGCAVDKAPASQVLIYHEPHIKKLHKSGQTNLQLDIESTGANPETLMSPQTAIEKNFF
jgi:hypothetical protein